MALVPALVGALRRDGWQVAVEPGAGLGALIRDQEYVDAGAVVDRACVESADLVVSVQPLDRDVLRRLRDGAVTVSLRPAASGAADLDLVRERRDRRISSFALDLVPRTARAQPMDALTSQSMVAGYRGAVVATELLRRFLPLAMTAAGTLPPARVLVLGAGVAGLQAIATIRRTGAVVQGYDVRPTSAQEIASLGAQALDLGLPSLTGPEGYARQLSEERATRQRELLAPYVAAADALITTAAVPGERAPVLVSTEMVAAMAPGSVVVDLAAESGGNVEGVVAGELVHVGRTLLWGGRDVAGQLPGPASRLYAGNVAELVALLAGGATALVPDLGDEILAACCVTHAGEIRHGPTRRLVES